MHVAMTVDSLTDITGLQYHRDYQFVCSVLSVSISGSIVVTHRDQRKSNEGYLTTKLFVPVCYCSFNRIQVDDNMKNYKPIVTCMN